MTMICQAQARRCVPLICVALAAATLALPAAAQQPYPAKPVNIVVPFPAGGSSDAMGRILAAELQAQLGQSFVVENRGGANGGIGSVAVARAVPDGYTLLISGVGSNAINYGLYNKLPYADKDFAHISLLATGPNVLVVNPEFPAKTIQEFLKLVKASPGKYQAANSGNGSSNHLGMQMLESAAGFKITPVPYKGGAAAISDTLAGHVPILTLNQDVLLPYVKSGKLRPIAVFSAERNPSYPNVPTIAESGFPGFSAVSWFGLAAPAGTPKAIIDKLAAASEKAMANPKVKEKLEAAGFVVVGSSPAKANEFVKAEIEKWGKTVRESGAMIE